MPLSSEGVVGEAADLLSMLAEDAMARALVVRSLTDSATRLLASQALSLPADQQAGNRSGRPRQSQLAKPS
jgi:hypothetical protein